MADSAGQDLRVRKTQLALSGAMLALLDQKSFAKITVNDLCQQAMVSRSTFYLHFEDKYQLLQYTLQQERCNLEDCADRDDPRAFLQRILTTIRERQRVYRNLFFNDVNVELLRMFQNVLHRFFAAHLTDLQEQGAELPGQPELVAVYCGGGVAAMIMWWIESDFPVSVEEMALCQYNLLTDILAD